jgi:hypothetical protein
MYVRYCLEGMRINNYVIYSFEEHRRLGSFHGVTMILVDNFSRTMKKREKWVLVRDTTGGGNRIYHRF